MPIKLPTFVLNKNKYHTIFKIPKSTRSQELKSHENK